MSYESLPDYCRKAVLVLGCGNILFGDDGFGPAVIQHLRSREPVPDNACLIDCHTSVRTILFDVILSDVKPRTIIVVDAMQCGGEPGAVIRIRPGDIPEVKLCDFSMHQIPTSNLLRELAEYCGVDVQIIVCNPVHIPDEVAPGLSEKVKAAVADAAQMILTECRARVADSARQTIS